MLNNKKPIISNNMRYLLFALISVITFVSCRIEFDGANHQCIPLDELTTMQGIPLHYLEYPFEEMIHYNPNNPNEIIFRLSDGVADGFELVKYNLETKERKEIYQGTFSNRPRWGKNGWILLNIIDSLGFNIYKIDETGNNLTALTTKGNCLNPEWDINSSSFIYSIANSSPAQYIIANDQGEIIDSTYAGVIGDGATWQHEKLIANPSFKGLVISDPEKSNAEEIFQTEALAQSLPGAVWLNNKEVFWCNTTGIYITNIESKETQIIRQTCNALAYQRPTYTQQAKKIILEKLERINEDDGTGKAIINVVSMNLDGTEEEIIYIE